MKRFIAFMLTVIMAVGMLAVGASATTKADLLAEAAKSPIYKYVKVAVENAARTVEITDEQAEQLLPVIKRAVAAVPEDKGPTARNFEGIYSDEEIEIVMSCIDEACAILRYTYTVTPSTDPKHPGDQVFMFYNENGKLVFQYDGDVVSDTDAATTVDTTAVLACAAALLIAGFAVVAVSKKRATVR